MPVEVGQIAPPFTLKAHTGEEVSLADFRGRKNVVLAFFPAAFSGVCTDQFSEIGAAEERYAGEDAQVLGISVDNADSLRAFAESLGLTDTLLLADFHPKAAVATEYGAYFEAAGLNTRASFVIDREGVVRYAEVGENPGEWIDQEGYFSQGLPACSV
ncbi:MAG: redoxin domain-containing protein [Miltoncostaeaceae bacterium]